MKTKLEIAVAARMQGPDSDTYANEDLQAACRNGYAQCKKHLLAAIQSQPDVAVGVSDTARLDFVLERQAYIKTIPGKGRYQDSYQLMEQDEDEDFIAISGEGVVYRSKREAIDVAMGSVQAQGSDTA